MFGPYIHNIDPIFAKVGAFYLWWYGLSYSLGFMGVFLWFRRVRQSMQMQLGEVYSLCICLASGVLFGGRLVEVFFYEWPYYGLHLMYIPAVWLGGMSTHGILLGALLGTLLFCKLSGRKFLTIVDELAIVGAYIMGVGRIGNFIDGQIVGSITNVWWAVQFPDAEGFRHPVVLYDGLKNLILVPFLLLIRRRHPPRGIIFAHFLLWYGFLRFFVDFFREYRTEFFGFPPGQEFNISMTVLGVFFLFWFYKKRNNFRDVKLFCIPVLRSGVEYGKSIWGKRVIFSLLLFLPLIIPSDWTQDIPKRYGKRHERLRYSPLYPRIEAATPTSSSKIDNVKQ